MGRLGRAVLPLWDDLFPAAPGPGKVGDPGLFGPGSAAWRLGRERVLLLGGPAALLLQVAHPLVGAGVAEHSDFAADPLRRLRGTLDGFLTVSFGDTAQVAAAVAAVARRHRPVHGRLSAAAGPFPAGSAYRADDPELALWVHATLVWTAVRVTETFLHPVPAADRDGYCADMAEVGVRFGAAADAVPRSWAALDSYVAGVVRNSLAVGPTATRLADQILTPDPPLVPPPLRPLPALLAAGLLPSAVREGYGLAWGRRDQVAFAALRRSVAVAAPTLPAPVRFWPHYRVAARRMAENHVVRTAARPGGER